MIESPDALKMKHARLLIEMSHNSALLLANPNNTAATNDLNRIKQEAERVESLMTQAERRSSNLVKNR